MGVSMQITTSRVTLTRISLALLLLVLSCILRDTESFPVSPLPRTHGTSRVSLHKKRCHGYGSRFTCRPSMMDDRQKIMESVQERNGVEEEYPVTIKDEAAPSLVSNSTIESTSVGLVVAATLQPPEDWMALWKRRLITHEDPFSIHKIASIMFALSGASILGTAAVRFAAGPDVFAIVPQGLLFPTYAFTISNVVMCLVSIRMAFTHRRYDLTARNAFLGTAASSLFSGFYYLWTNPLGPDIFNQQWVTQTCFATLVVLNLVLILDTCFRVESVVEGRRDGKAEDYDGRLWIDALAYVFPVAWGLPFVLATGWVDAVLYNREWFFQQCLYIDQQTGASGMQANLCYLQVLTSFGPAFGALFVTLRDKKLISKRQEITGITIFSVPALVWTIWVTATFFAYMTWE